MSTRLRSSWEATTLLSCTTRMRTHCWQHPSSWTWSLLAELCERIEVKRGEGGREGGREGGKKEGREGGGGREGGREGGGRDWQLQNDRRYGDQGRVIIDKFSRVDTR